MITLDMVEYNKATLTIYDLVFLDQEFYKEADATILHEMLHIVMHPLTTFCYNMFEGDEGKRRELERLEEQVVTSLEKSIVGLKAKA